MAQPTSPPLRRVAVLIRPTRSYARGLIRGIGRYNRERRRWSVWYGPHLPDDRPAAGLRGWKGDGILARIGTPSMLEAVRRTGLPVVDLRRALRDPGIPTLGPDDRAVARLAFRHLYERGLRRFGVVAGPRGGHPALDTRADHFARLAREAGCPCAVLRLRAGPHAGAAWERAADRAARWVRALRAPTGVLAVNDDWGLLLLDACRRAGAAVPDDVAVLGAGNDDCLCDLAVPPLTSVDLDPERIGYEAAARLDAMMDGGDRRARPVLVEPAGVVTRASTDVLATGDPAVVRAVRFIRDRAGDGIRVADVLRHIGMSRGALDPRMAAVRGRTAGAEIRHARIERAKELLAGTDVPLKRVAAQAGFRHPEYMMRAFRRAVGITAGAFRKRARRGARP